MLDPFTVAEGAALIVIGADSHKRTHTVVALDAVGRRVAEKTVPTTTEGHLALVAWAAQWPQVRFALEDCRHLTRRLEQDLLAALRHDDLPVAELDGPTREVKLLVDYRRDLVRQRTRVQNRLRWHLHELDPALHVPSRGLRRYRVIDDLLDRLADVPGVVARLARELLSRCRELTAQINALEAELKTLVRRLAPSLLALPGCGVLGRR